MLQQTKYKAFIGIIKSGLVGLFALTGVYIVLIIASPRSPTASFLVYFLPNLGLSSQESFILIGVTGFISGIIGGRFFPMIKRGILPLVIALVMLVGSLGWFAIWFVHTASMNIEQLPLSLKLADCTNNVVSIHLKIPPGHDYQLDLKTPETQVSTGGESSPSYNFSGHLRISSDGSLIADLPINSDHAGQNGWYRLAGTGMQNTNVPPLSKFIQSNKSYDFEISFESMPPPASSIWLYCLESKRDN